MAQAGKIEAQSYYESRAHNCTPQLRTNLRSQGQLDATLFPSLYETTKLQKNWGWENVLLFNKQPKNYFASYREKASKEISEIFLFYFSVKHLSKLSKIKCHRAVIGGEDRQSK